MGRRPETGAWHEHNDNERPDFSRVALAEHVSKCGKPFAPLVAFSVFATWFGAEAIVATSGEVYEHGLVGAAVDPFAYAAAVVISGVMLASVLWRKGLTTFADMFRERYSREVEALVVVVLVPGSIFWAAAQIRAFGGVLSSSSGFSRTTTIVFAAAGPASGRLRCSQLRCECGEIPKRRRRT